MSGEPSEFWKWYDWNNLENLENPLFVPVKQLYERGYDPFRD